MQLGCIWTNKKKGEESFFEDYMFCFKGWYYQGEKPFEAIFVCSKCGYFSFGIENKCVIYTFIFYSDEKSGHILFTL